MDIKISNEKSVGEVQSEFKSVFPFLKIEFLKKNGAEPNSQGHAIPERTRIGVICSLPAPGLINIGPERTVEEIEKDFLSQMGLLVQIFRRSGNVWVATTLTDRWSLDRQNHAGELMS
jgi:hypothetical protein